MAVYGIDYNDPLFKYSPEERRNMTEAEYGALLDAHNEYLEKKWLTLNEQTRPKFKTTQEMIDYYEAIPFDEAMNNLYKLFDEFM
jgi:hypothetical protein